ncbi:MAG: DUF3617 domain-containing protein [Steroidobacterales bacterium]
MNKSLLRGLPVAAVIVLASPMVFQAFAADPPQGDQWETTTRMSMEGMPMQMPAQTLKICAKRNPTEPPGAGRQNCTNTNFNRTGNKVTWEVHCTGPEMTGTGEIVYDGTDSYTGTIQFVSAQGNMTINMTGRKLGTCNNPQ